MSYTSSGSSADTFEGTYLVDEVLDGEKGYARGPERSLLSALLFDGIQAYLNFITSTGGRAVKRYQEAFAWVNTRDSEYVFSFESVCEGLGVDAEFLRLGLINAAESLDSASKRRRRTF